MVNYIFFGLTITLFVAGISGLIYESISNKRERERMYNKVIKFVDICGDACEKYYVGSVSHQSAAKSIDYEFNRIEKDIRKNINKVNVEDTLYYIKLDRFLEKEKKAAYTELKRLRTVRVF
jgi:putative heme degradation protein